MIDPEPADCRIRVGQGVAVGGQGWAKYVGLKSMPIRRDFAQSIQPRKCSGSKRVALDLPAAGLGIAGVEVQAMWPGRSDSVLSRSERSSSGVRALPG